MDWHLLHPVAVHFPIALLTAGLVAQAGTRLRRAPPWLPEAAAWLLWIGTAAAWAALGLGLLAEETVPHVPAAWEVLEEHETLAWWTAGSFTVLSFLRWRWRENRPLLVLGLWLAAVGLLYSTAFHGGELVYDFGVGVKRD